MNTSIQNDIAAIEETREMKKYIARLEADAKSCEDLLRDIDSLIASFDAMEIQAKKAGEAAYNKAMRESEEWNKAFNARQAEIEKQYRKDCFVSDLKAACFVAGCFITAAALTICAFIHSI